MGLLNNPKKMNALMNFIGILEKAKNVKVDVSVWVNGIEKGTIENALNQIKI